MLLRERGHVGPVIVDVCNPVGHQNFVVLSTYETRVPYLGRITEIFRKLTEESVQSRTELLRGHPVALKLEEERAGMPLEFRLSVWRQDQFIEQFRIEDKLLVASP